MHVDGIVDVLGVYYFEPLLVACTATYLAMICTTYPASFFVPAVHTGELK